MYERKTSMKVLTTEQRNTYFEEGYLHLRGIVPDYTVLLGRKVLSEWADWQISEWQKQGLLDRGFEDEPFEKRLLLAWRAAGNPHYVRSPRRDIATVDMFRFLGNKALVDVAEDLLETPDILAHGVFNARPKLPDQLWTDTPWHQDAQYYTEAEHKPVISMWIPIVPVSERNSCLQVAPRMHRGALHEAVNDKTGFVGLSPELQQDMDGVSVEMQTGDVLCFTERMPHRALPNKSDTVRWSMDIRFEALAGATSDGLDKGFVARCADASRETDCETWLKLWEDLPRGTY